MRATMASAGEEVRAKMADPFSLGGFIPEVDRWGVKKCSIDFGTGKAKLKVRSQDMDANISKISEDKRLGVWRGPHVYSYFDTRIVRRSNMLLADLANRPYGAGLNFMEYAWVGYHLWAETTNGHEIKCSMIGRDGYMETARVAIETAMCLLFDKLPFKGD